ncbi:ABC transporter permease [Murimonas intestini]|uniref:Transport permease protein n=1 Tax=Murimonas intestini TaxID=1337051 RepID=A0AB73SYU6_9FIRM|nr:ABC transporter permease [Murimonas intestini]MCR1842981.1 ABC transporter permease [Murimonas intestini]MCR1867982.1 ABC transporter permease [Murimonas intestini]MCR1885450.1 ABC transporter permease [Murimonas intestini]
MNLIGRMQGFYKYKDLLVQLVSRDLKLKYRRSFLGYVWSILNPLLLMLVMTIVFSHIFRFDIANYPVYLIIGQTLYNYMNNSTTHAIYSITDNGPLLKKTYVPKYIFTLAKITSGLVDFLFSLGAMLLVMIFTGISLNFKMLYLPVIAVQLYLFCLGLGMFLAQAAVFFRDIQYIYNVVLMAWMYCTPVFYPMDVLPATLQWLVSHFNPLYIYIQQFRSIVLENQFVSMRFEGLGWLYAFIALLLGCITFFRSQDKFILYI